MSELIIYFFSICTNSGRILKCGRTAQSAHINRQRKVHGGAGNNDCNVDLSVYIYSILFPLKIVL